MVQVITELVNIKISVLGWEKKNFNLIDISSADGNRFNMNNIMLQENRSQDSVHPLSFN